ncbi:MAG: hypothetical protein ACRC8W_11215 [Plesiomonas shigelloides]
MTEKVRIELLNDGGYGDMTSVNFPAEVEGTPLHDDDGELYGYDVHILEIYGLLTCQNDQSGWGGDVYTDSNFCFLLHTECHPL